MQPPLQQQFDQMNIQGGGNNVLPPRQNANLDDSLHANYGYNESTKRAAALPESSAGRVQQQPIANASSAGGRTGTAARPQPAGPSQPALRAGPMGAGGPGGPGAQGAKGGPAQGAPLPAKRPAMPAMPAPLPSSGPQGAGRPAGAMSSFNPAQLAQQPQVVPPHSTSTGHAPRAGPIRAPPIARAPQMQPGPGHQ